MRRKKANCKLFLCEQKNHQLHTVIYKIVMSHIGITLNSYNKRREELGNLKHLGVKQRQYLKVVLYRVLKRYLIQHLIVMINTKIPIH